MISHKTSWANLLWMKKWMSWVLFGTLTGLSLGCASMKTPAEDVENIPLNEKQFKGVLLVPEALDVLKVNNKSVAKLFGLGDRRFNLMPGRHQIELRYSQLWEMESEDHDLVKSKVQTINVNIAAGAEYRLNHEKATNLAESRKVAEDLKVWITTDKESALTVAEKQTLEVKQPDSHQLQQLKYWWERTSRYDKKSFKFWLISAED